VPRVAWTTGDLDVHHIAVEAVLPAVVRPMAIGLKTDEIRRVITVGEPEPL
jgi:hypothetical protein